jgi:hypothetical protein
MLILLVRKQRINPHATLAQEGTTTDIIANFLGVEKRTLKKAEAIVEVAEQNPNNLKH